MGERIGVWLARKASELIPRAIARLEWAKREIDKEPDRADWAIVFILILASAVLIVVILASILEAIL